MPETYFIRKAVIQLDTGEPEYQWQDDAACAFQPHTLFEVAGFDDRISQGIAPDGGNPEEAIKDLNAANFKRAQEICNTCPVWHLCYTEAEEDDFEWTVRAGIIPSKFNPTLRGRPVVTSKSCPEGHDMIKRKGNGWYCLPCQNAKAMDRRREKGIQPIKKREPFSRGKLCKSGQHDEWIKHPRGVHECWPCKQERQAGYAKMDA